MQSMQARSGTTSRGLALGGAKLLPPRRSCNGSQRKASPLLTPRRLGVGCAALIPQLLDGLTSLAEHLPLAYEPVALPCSLMKCGDAVYRSTLDLELRGELRGLDWRGLLLLASIAVYLFVPPGAVPAMWDYYVLSKFHQRMPWTKDDVILGRKLGGGGFGTVYQGQLSTKSGQDRPLIIKKAKEFGEAEVWMNERMMRAGGNYIAPFLTAFDERTDDKRQANNENNAIWLLWADEGAVTLSNLMLKRDFPYNVEPLLFGRELDDLPKAPQRKLVVVKLLMRQLFEALGACHSTGIVHRDVKPENIILSGMSRKVKFIDLGAAADLRIGINYVPNEYLLDPRYAPPQQYVMSTQTVAAPPAPVAALLSPILWIMEQPDKFDMYSAGITMLQFVFPPLRNDNNLIAFNKKFQASKCDIRQWRKEEERKGLSKEMQEAFELLDMDLGAGFDLLQSLLAYRPRDRLSVADALEHPWFGELSLTSLMRSAGRLIRADEMEQALLNATAKEGALSEASLAQEFGLGETRPLAPLDTRRTLAWWQERQESLRKGSGRKQASDLTAMADEAKDKAMEKMKEKMAVFAVKKANKP